MRLLVVWNVMALDGYFEGRTPWDLGFHETVWGDELEAFSLEQGQEIGTLLFGRRTYDGMAGHWTKETGAVADMMNSVEKAVAARTLEAADWNNTRLLKGDAVDAVNGLRAETGKDIYVFGSADLLASLLKAGLVDEYRVCVALSFVVTTQRPG
jgi:dihydrofolate reductase